MNTRRHFIKTLVAGTAGLTLLSSTSLFAKSKKVVKTVKDKISLPMNVVFSEKHKGKWAKKKESHVPVVTIKDGKATLETKHVMNEKHYIIRHTLVTADGEYIGGRTFYPGDKKAISTFDLPKGKKAFIATSYCNLHDLWITEFTV